MFGYALFHLRNCHSISIQSSQPAGSLELTDLPFPFELADLRPSPDSLCPKP